MYPILFSTPGVAAFAQEIDAERARQLAKFGDQQHPDGTGNKSQQDDAVQARRWCEAAFGSGYGTWADVLAEEVAEANAERDPAKLRAELIQVAAVCAAWIYAIDQRPAAEEQPTPTGHTHKLGNPDDDGLLDDWDNCRDPECPGPGTTVAEEPS